jgi:hypothetical protein
MQWCVRPCSTGGARCWPGLRSWFRPLEVIASLAPLLGLFGTVLGMIKAFQQLESAGSQVNPAILSGGIWEALLTTAVGLAVAIPVVALLNWLERRVDRLAIEMESVLNRFYALELDAEAPAPARPATNWTGRRTIMPMQACAPQPRRLAAEPRRRRALISMTPLIDVVFILLIFFMLASSFLNWRSSGWILPARAGARRPKCSRWWSRCRPTGSSSPVSAWTSRAWSSACAVKIAQGPGAGRAGAPGGRRAVAGCDPGTGPLSAWGGNGDAPGR